MLGGPACPAVSQELDQRAGLLSATGLQRFYGGKVTGILNFTREGRSIEISLPVNPFSLKYFPQMELLKFGFELKMELMQFHITVF